MGAALLSSAMASSAIPIEPALAPRWQLRLLGAVELRAADVSISRWPSRAVAALLARLALAPHRDHPREELIELLWPGVSLDKGRPRLRQALSLLRSLLRSAPGPWPEVLLADRHAVRLTAHAVSCDVLRLEQHLAAGEQAAAQALYIGELMPGYYDDWIVAERHRLEALRESWQAAPRRHSIEPPWLPPQEATASTPWRTSLPSYWTRPFGQEATLAQLMPLLQDHRLVTVTGPGGMGKTRLAVALADQLIRQSPNTAAKAWHFELVAFVSLAATETASELWSALAQALVEDVSADPRSQVTAGLGQRTALLVLDNMEQVSTEAVDGLAHLLQQAGGLHLLLTSRRRLGLPGEQVYDMPGLPLPPREEGLPPDILTLGQNPSVALFVDRARDSRPEFHLTVNNVLPVVDLVALLGGMPLAIELAASRLRALQPRELLVRLQSDQGSPLLELLARPGSTATAAARHASMRHVVAWSWRQLSPELASLLRAMSVFGHAATLTAVGQALAGLDDADAVGAPAVCTADPARVQALLADAVDLSLVKAEPTKTLPVSGRPDSEQAMPSTRYALLPPVREFAAEQCAPGEPVRVRARLRRWLADLARQGLPRHRQALQQDLVHAWGLLQRAQTDNRPGEALALAVALQSEWNWRPSAPALMSVTEWALGQHHGRRSDALVSEGHYLVVALATLRADMHKAAVHADAAVATAPDDRLLALALSIRCWVGQQRGDDPSTLQPELSRALHLARQGHDVRVLGLVLRLQAAQSAYHLNDPVAAEPLFQECVQLFEQAGDSAQAWLRQIELAGCWARTGREPSALVLLDMCLRERPAMAQSLVLIYALTELGRVQLRLRAPQAAQAALVQAADLAQRHDWPGLLLPALLPLPEAWVICGQAEPAALLHGHVMARWPATIGGFNRRDAWANRRTRRLLARALSGARADLLLQVGAGLTQAQALQLLRESPPRHTCA